MGKMIFVRILTFDDEYLLIQEETFATPPKPMIDLESYYEIHRNNVDFGFDEDAKDDDSHGGATVTVTRSSTNNVNLNTHYVTNRRCESSST